MGPVPVACPSTLADKVSPFAAVNVADPIPCNCQKVDQHRHVLCVPTEIRGGPCALPSDRTHRENGLARFNRADGSFEWRLSRRGADRDARQRYRESSNQYDEQSVRMFISFLLWERSAADRLLFE